MGLNTKCPVHGNEHSDFACPALFKAKEILSRFYDPENVTAWLNSPNPELGERTPQSMIDEGQVGIVLDMLKAALAGVSS